MGTEHGTGVLRAVLLTGTAVLVILSLSVLYTVFYAPVGQGSEMVLVRVESGSTLGTISSTLASAGVVSHPRLFFWSARLAGLERKLRSGDYEVYPSWKMPRLLDTLASGRSRLLSVTLPEGITVTEVASRLEAAGITDGAAFLELSRERELLDSLGIPGETAEGFLFPETYLFASSSRPRDVITAMVRQFWSVFEELRAANPGETLSPFELVTLASIVEKETGLPEERPLIAAVFVNRLARGTRLQSDPTVIYGMKDFNGNITRRDLKTPTPYNTYLIAGLPPGPIANPGRGALWATMSPAQVDYLYFVSKNDGSHQFSKSLKEHNRAVRQYQMAGRKR
jgi:UPF0755 protein